VEAQWEPLVCAYPWPCSEALAVIQCESSGDPNAENGGSLGLMQIHYASHWDKVDGPAALYDPATNIAVGYQLYADYGSWYHWRFSAECHGLWP